MQEGLYEIVRIERTNHGKWVFTARPVNNEISFECESDSLEEGLFKFSRETLWLCWTVNQGQKVLHDFEVKGENRQ